jgi:hypothetical protein
MNQSLAIQVSNSGEAGTLINPADMDMDEEEERRAFTEAVMEWRRMASKDSKPSASGLWSNPIMDDEDEDVPLSNSTNAYKTNSSAATTNLNAANSLLEGDLDEEKERKASLRIYISYLSDRLNRNLQLLSLLGEMLGKPPR